jgi:hypothetical protein
MFLLKSKEFMATLIKSEPLNEELVAQLRQLASTGTSLEQMVDYVQGSLGFPKLLTVPVLPYFCRAFELPLIEVLPLREWIVDRDDREVEQLRAKIREFNGEEIPQTQEKRESKQNPVGNRVP